MNLLAIDVHPVVATTWEVETHCALRIGSLRGPSVPMDNDFLPRNPSTPADLPKDLDSERHGETPFGVCPRVDSFERRTAPKNGHDGRRLGLAL